MSNENNFFGFNRTMFDEERLTMNDLKNSMTKRKERQILEHRKKIMKEIYTKMFKHNPNKPDDNINKDNNMEIEEEINNNINENENKKKLIEKCLSNAKDLYDNLGEDFIYQVIDDKK